MRKLSSVLAVLLAQASVAVPASGAAEGRHWPDGEVRHIYTHTGSYDIVVTEGGTATWRLGGQSGVLRELRTSGRVDDYP